MKNVADSVPSILSLLGLEYAKKKMQMFGYTN